MIESILEKVSFNNAEFAFYKESLKSYNSKEIMSEHDYESVDKALKEFLPCKINDDYHFTFSTTATDLIKQLFKKYVDDDTLVLTTNSEHPKVQEILKKCKNVVKAFDKESLQQFTVDNKYKRVFIYMIGTMCATGHIVYDQEFESIIERAKASGKEVITVIDAVQELFLLHRDYNKFDYIIGTAHALIPEYNVGLMLSKDTSIGKHLMIAQPFVTMLKWLLKRKEYLYQFSTFMSMEFGNTRNTQFYHDFGISHLFFIKTRNGEFNQMQEEDTVKDNIDNVGVLFRGCWSVVDRETFDNLLQTTKFIVEGNI